MHFPCRLLLVLLIGAPVWAQPAPGDERIADPGGSEHVSVTRSILTVRADPAGWAGAAACAELRPSEILLRTRSGTIAATHVERISEPAVHWLLVDMSDSTAEGHEGSRQAALRYVEQILRPGLDRAALVTVDEDTLLRQAPTSDPAELRRTLESVPAGNQSLLRDGLAEVLLEATGRDEQHVIVFWTDGLDTTRSFHTLEDLRRILARTPNVTIFPIAIVPPGVTSLPAQSANQLLHEVAEASHGTVYFGQDRRWVEGIRGWLHRRWTVTFSPDEPLAIEGGTIATTRRGCTLTVAPGAPASARASRSRSAGEVPDGWLRAFTSQKRQERTMGCMPEARGGPAATLAPAGERLRGCALDLVQDRGQLLDGPHPGRFAWRPVSVHTPPLARIPRSPDDLLESLLELQETGAEIDSLLVNGRTARALARLVARTLHASRDEYRAFAATRIAARSDRALEALAREFRSEFPGFDPALLEQAVRESEAARRIRARVAAPTDAQLQDILAAPLGDVPAVELFRRLEERRIRAQLAGTQGAAEAAARIVAGWSRLREPFAAASSRRVVAPLVPAMSREGDRIGFWRIVLPRPSAVSLRKVRTTADTVPFDLVPQQPIALWLWSQALRARPDLPDRLRAEGARTVTVRYEPLGRPDLEDPVHALRSARVRVRIEVDPAAVSTLDQPSPLAAISRLLSAPPFLPHAQRVPGGTPEPLPPPSGWMDPVADEEQEDDMAPEEADPTSPPRLDLVAEVSTGNDDRLVLRSVRVKSHRSRPLQRLGRELVRSMRAQLAGESSTSR